MPWMEGEIVRTHHTRTFNTPDFSDLEISVAYKNFWMVILRFVNISNKKDLIIIVIYCSIGEHTYIFVSSKHYPFSGRYIDMMGRLYSRVNGWTRTIQISKDHST